MRHLRVGTIAVVFLLPLLGACRDDSVRIGFAPAPGATYRYDVHVEAVSDLTIEGSPTEHRVDEVTLRSTHTVLSSAGGVTQVRVRLDDPTGAVDQRTFVVRYDRTGQLIGVDRVESLTADILANVGLADVLPAALSAPPARPLRAGDRWRVSRPIELPGTATGTVQGWGRLVGFGVENAARVATVATDTLLEVERTRAVALASTTLAGTQSNRAEVTHDLSDGSVARARSVTTGQFDLKIEPSGGATGPGLVGQLALRITSTTRRR